VPDAGFQLSGRQRRIILSATAVLVLVLVNLEIVRKEAIVREGTTVLLPLAPADPRSLLQGDYMALRYAMARHVAEEAEAAGISDGVAVIELDDEQRAQFVALYQGQGLAESQHLLQFRKRGHSVRLASDAYFFEEGRGDTFANARFGELRVSADGTAVLVGLRDGQGRRLGS
jgi:uncharacterized membrane-anchored protein